MLLLETDPAKGLTAEQAAQRMAAGLDNRAAASPTRSETEIIRDNIFTFFNLVFIVLALCLALVGSFANMTFLGVVIANTIIGTVQQLRSKRTVDGISLNSKTKQVASGRFGVTAEYLVAAQRRAGAG